MKLKSILQLFSKNKQYYLTTILTLSLMLTVVFIVFSLTSLVFWKPLPYSNNDNLFWLEGTMDYQGTTFPGTNTRNLRYIESNSQDIDGFGAYFKWSQYKLTEKVTRPEVDVIMATHRLFDVLGASPFMGRLFNEKEKLGNHQLSAILSYHVWKEYFNSEQKIIGKKIRLNNRNFTIVGVAQPEMVLPQEDSAYKAIWIPFDMDEKLNPKTFKGYSWAIKSVVNLKPNVSYQVASENISDLMKKAAELNTPNIYKQYPIGAKLTPFVEAVKGDSVKLVYTLLCGAVLLLSISIVNLSNFQLSRAIMQRKKRAISASFGATKIQLYKEVTFHNLLVTTLSSVIALFMTYISFGVVKELITDLLPRTESLSINYPVFLLVIITIIFITVVFSIIEFRNTNFTKLNNDIQSSGKGSGVQVRNKVVHIIIGIQLSLGLIVLVSSGHVLYSMLKESYRPTGLNTDFLSSIHISLANVKSKVERENLFRNLVNEIKKINGVEAVSYSSESRLPAEININSIKFNENVITSARKITQDLLQFDLYKLTIEGDNFTESEITSQIPVVIINERLAGYLPKPTIGQKISIGDSNLKYTIKGIVSNTDFPGSSNREIAEVYLPSNYEGQKKAVLLIKLKQESIQPNLTALYSTLTKIHPQLDILKYSTVEEDFDEISRASRIGAMLALSLALSSLILVIAGIYGIVNYMIRLRRYHLGIHLSFGATPKKLLTENMLELHKPIIGSVIFSSSLIYFVSGYVRTKPEILFELNWLVFSVSIILLMCITFISCFLPLYRAVKLNPIFSLRNQ